MAALFNLKIVACDGIFYDGPCQQLIFEGEDGQVGIMGHHEPMTGAVEIGNLRMQMEDGSWQTAVVSDGFITVYPGGNAKILVYSCEKPEDIDAFRAQEALERAQEQLREKQSIQEYHISRANMARAMARLAAVGAGTHVADYNK